MSNKVAARVMLTLGYSIKEIARELSLSPETIKRYCYRYDDGWKRPKGQFLVDFLRQNGII